MTKTLTEQWREGTLPEDCYYILTKNGHIKKDRTCFYSHTDEQCFCFISNNDIEEVLAPVPNYNESMQKTYTLEKKLAIATKGLKDIALARNTPCSIILICYKTFKEMEGVK